MRDLKVIAGRTELLSESGQEVAVRKVWVNPDYDGETNSGDFAVLSLAEPLPAASVIGMAGSGDAAYRAGTPATVYGWGDTTGSGSYAGSLHGSRVRVQPDALCEKAYLGLQRHLPRRDDAVRG